MPLESIIRTVSDFVNALQDPEYFHLFMQPVLTWGLAFGLLTFLFGLIIREQKTQVFALIIMICSSWAIVPYLHDRAASKERITRIYQHDEPQRVQGFEAKTNDWTQKRWLYYASGWMAAITVLIGAGRSRLSLVFGAATALVASTAILYGWWAHYQESKIYHPNLRSERPIASSIPSPQPPTR